MSSSTDPLVTVARFATAGEAHVARTALEAAGIAALVMEQDGLRFAPFGPPPREPVRLQVRSADAEAATELLAAASAPDGAER